ncbi:MAG: CRISPR-associated endoribonuclease Cas6 [Bacteroidota bacterium]|nr:CRISPR-associated endoribonuclease Cas6 [Bacteroidota bacterium]MDP4195496.1 CRISPR-associated endoribonuclease Cas6 [Bacteroidota bacterium]
MRLLIKLKATKEKEFIYNYNSSLSEEISNLLGLDSDGLKDFLSQKNYRFADKPFRLFTFALHFENVLHRSNKLYLRSHNAYLYLSFPLIDQYIKDNVLESIRAKSEIAIKRCPNTVFTIQNLEVLPDPIFNDQMEFDLRSPVIISIRRKIKDIPTNFYLTFKDNPYDISRIITEDLKRKYSLIYNKELPNAMVKLDWDRNFIEDKLRNKKKLTAKLSIEINHRKSIVVGNITPFRLRGNKELLQIGYDTGFGFLNSLGFGLADARSGS